MIKQIGPDWYQKFQEFRNAGTGNVGRLKFIELLVVDIISFRLR